MVALRGLCVLSCFGWIMLQVGVVDFVGMLCGWLLVRRFLLDFRFTHVYVAGIGDVKGGRCVCDFLWCQKLVNVRVCSL